MNAKIGNLASRAFRPVLLGSFLTFSLSIFGQQATAIKEEQVSTDASDTQPASGFSTETSAAQTGSADQNDDSGIVAPGSGNGGALDFQADLYTGRFTYKVPIVLPPGRQGAQPSLALGYNSALGNGWCGVGWSLSLPYIERDIRKGVPILWNPASSPTPLTQYDDSKSFVATLSGSISTLVRTSAANQNPVVYRQQVDETFITYNYYTNDNHWEAIDKTGTTFYFGQGSTNRMENAKTGWTAGVGASTFRWALNKVVDANGNLTTFSYTTDTGSLYLTNIAYNGNVNSPALATTHTIDFILTSRPDTNITFVSGYRVTMARRLSEIQIKVSGSNVRKYVLNYTTSGSTTRSLLSSVTQYGSDFATALPPITFNYQVKPFQFAAAVNMPGQASEGQTVAPWNSIRAFDSDNLCQVTMIDIDGDGLPDRVMREIGAPFNTYFTVERNTGTNFVPGSPYFTWGPLDSQGITSVGWNSPIGTDSDGATFVDMVDINGDGYPDRVMRESTAPYTNYDVQLNSGFAYGFGVSNSFSADTIWLGVTNVESLASGWESVHTRCSVALVDINGDGLPDRVSKKVNGPLDRFKVQLNTGTGFLPPVDWNGVDSPGATDGDWHWPSHFSTDGNFYTILIDINGDGLPDRVIRHDTTPFTSFYVQFNNGAGFEPLEIWGPLDTQGNNANGDWGTPIGSNGQVTRATLIDINGDGLPDHVMRRDTAPYTNWVVQLNTGSGFGPTNAWGPIDAQGQPNDAGWNAISFRNGGAEIVVDMIDINGDGLPDRVMRSLNSPYDHLVVQTNKGPFPDLLCTASNGMGGSLQVTYAPSTSVDNRNTNYTGDPWAAGTKSLLPFNTWVVSQITSSDGMGTVSSNTYYFKGGYWNAAEQEFRGFSQAEVTDSGRTLTRTYFHQSGGRDNTALGEYLDQGSESKKGMPFRTEVIGNDGLTNSITLNKIEEVKLNPNGWYFPFTSQTIKMVYEGLSSYRATAKQFTYDTNTGNLTISANLGEVTNVVINGQTFTDIGNDSVYTWITYASLGNILSRGSDIKHTSDSSGSTRLRETLLAYDSRGNQTNTQAWLDTAGAFIVTSSSAYDQYGNPTSTIDAAGISTTTTYDSTYKQYPITKITGTFTNLFALDAKSGLRIQSTDPKGLVVSNYYDVFFRTRATSISTNAYGTPTLWKTKVDYALGGIVNGVSSNYVHKQVNDAIDTINGYETYSYVDGLGRIIQSRAEAENGQFRISDTLYDQRGQPNFRTYPSFSSGGAFTILTGTNLGTFTEYDSIGRPYRVTSAVQAIYDGSGNFQSITFTSGDTGSPVGSVTTAFNDGSNPWAVVATDSEGKVRKFYQDAYGRKVKIVEVTANGNFTTTYAWDLVGNLTNSTDNASNSSRMAYDSLGRKTAMVDPDMGTWTYAYDNDGRLIQQVDAKTNKLKFYYSDPLGRISSREIYNPGNALVGTITYLYDTNYGDSAYTVFPGQLYKVTDLEGWQKNSYDVRGRVVKGSRYLNVTTAQYDIQTTYDDADRVQQIVYPGNAATIKYSYDTAGNLSQVKSLGGTGTQEIFYTPQSYNALGQVTGFTYGNGVVSTNLFYANSKRIQRMYATRGGTNEQDLSYTYDTVSNVKTISDGVYSGSQSGSLTNIVYDDLYRVITVGATARGVKSYAYSSIGNILTNQDLGTGQYLYGSKPHAVTNANGASYTYDLCGNMITRSGQTLTYDEQNQLIQAGAVTFGYAEGGTRLWRNGATGYTIWIGGIYEINSGRTLCHVFAGGQRIATFEPQGGGPWASIFGEKRWFLASNAIQPFLVWPFQHGRSQFVTIAIAFGFILAISLISRRRCGLSRVRYPSHALWKRGIAFVSIAVLLFAESQNAEAQTYTPVFYYYQVGHLGSTNVLTDRAGYRVQHYEYSTFGQTSSDNGFAFQVSNLYTGEVLDETGLYYYNCRYYDPGIGRFIQSDTLVPGASNPQNLNRYSYVNNNPLNLTDPSGHGSFFDAIFNADLGTLSNYKTWIGVVIGGVLGGWYGALFALGASMLTAQIAATTNYIYGPKEAKIAGLVASIILALVGAYTGAANAGSSSTSEWTAIGSAALQIGSASAGYAGERNLSEAFGYAATATAVFGAFESYLESHSEAPPENADVIEIKGVGERSPNDTLSGRGMLLDIKDAILEKFGIYDGRVARYAAEIAGRIDENNANDIPTLFRPHSQGTELLRGVLWHLNSMGVDLSRTYVQLNGSPLAKVEMFGSINLSHVSVMNHPLDPIHNAFGSAINPVQMSFGLLSGAFTLQYHSSQNVYHFH